MSSNQSNICANGGRVGEQLKSAPDGAETPGPGLTASKERLMSQRITPETVDHKATAKLFLELAADDLAKAKRARDHYVGLSSKYGLSNVEIGACLGISESRVRAILAGAL
jgi:PIN domain nuclease of toxin-antitoxin system